MTADLSPYLDAIEADLERLLTPTDPATQPLLDMMRYHLGWLDAELRPARAPRGKRIRPLLCLLACEAAGGDWQRALPAACSIELVHNFTLLHDDIEDASETRRHRPTAWALWGVPQALNTGDALWAVARLAVYGLSANGYDAETVLAAARRLDEACLLLCAGQYLDLHFEQVERVTVAEYTRMIAGKTAALLSASLAIGAALGGAAAPAVEALAAAGTALGLAFQAVDDILGVWGEPTATGKSAATDILARKKTLPVLHALGWEREHGFTDLAALYARPLGPEDVPVVLALLERAGSRAFAEAWAGRQQSRALQDLHASGCAGPALAALEEVAVSLLHRAA